MGRGGHQKEGEGSRHGGRVPLSVKQSSPQSPQTTILTMRGVDASPPPMARPTFSLAGWAGSGMVAMVLEEGYGGMGWDGVEMVGVRVIGVQP